MMTTLAAVFGSWVLLFLVLLLFAAYMIRLHVTVTYEDAPQADPFEGEMQAWRKQVHDWTRDN